MRWLALPMVALVACAEAEPLEWPRDFQDASPGPTCAECWPTCASPRDDRAAYWCVRGCVAICDAERADATPATDAEPTN